VGGCRGKADSARTSSIDIGWSGITVLDEALGKDVGSSPCSTGIDEWGRNGVGAASALDANDGDVDGRSSFL